MKLAPYMSIESAPTSKRRLRTLVALAAALTVSDTHAFAFLPLTSHSSPTRTLCRMKSRPAGLYVTLPSVFPDLVNQTDNSKAEDEDKDKDDFPCSIFEEVSLTKELNPVEDQGVDGDDDLHWFRFGGVGRLYEDDENPQEVILDRLKLSTVAVVGLGGVGSWAAEALCRSGIGHLVLIDLDDVCISNTNRQLHTLSTNVGAMKTEAMRDRLVSIHPYCQITLIHDFVMVDNVHEIVGQQLKAQNVDLVIDAIDGDEEKAALIAACTDHSIPIISTGSTAGKSDPTQIIHEDLSNVEDDEMMRSCRDRLVREFGFQKPMTVDDSKKSGWNIPCIYSKQAVKRKSAASASSEFGVVENSFRCDGSLGTASFVTGSFGFVAASRAVEMITGEDLVPPSRSRK